MRSENIENMARIISNRVRYHAPIVYDDDMDFKVLEDFGIDTSLPIFKFEKEMSKPLEKAFLLAKKMQNFNLVTSKKTNCKFALFLPENTNNLRLLQMINKLNINYKSNSQYNPKFLPDELKIGGKVLNLKFNDFCLEKHQNIDGIFVSEKKFVCNGECDIIELLNSSPKENKIEIEYNKNLPFGNYHFSKQNGSIKITNLFSKEVKFFNTTLSLSDVFFSCIDGVEFSSFACVRFKKEIRLKPYQKKYIFLNFGESYLKVRSVNDMLKLFDFSKKKCYENFNVRIYTDNHRFDENFNVQMPRDIWLNWLNDKKDIELENEYVKMKETYCIEENGKVFFKKEDYSNFREIDVFDGIKFRKIYICNSSNQNSLQIGNALFQNLKSFCLNKIKSKTQICLHFK